MNDVAGGRITLSKAQRNTPAGQELLALLTELSADGQVAREEMERLRAWLEVERGVDFAACGFLYDVVDAISSDGVISDEELDSLALAIERVLPPEVRLPPGSKGKSIGPLCDEQERRRVRRRATRIEARQRARPLHRGDFLVAGALRSAERREANECVKVGDAAVLEREPDNVHDSNAILVLTSTDEELGYVPRDLAKQMAPLLDAGAEASVVVRKFWHTPSGGHPVAIVTSTLRHSSRSEAASLCPHSATGHNIGKHS